MNTPTTRLPLERYSLFSARETQYALASHDRDDRLLLGMLRNLSTVAPVLQPTHFLLNLTAHRTAGYPPSTSCAKYLYLPLIYLLLSPTWSASMSDVAVPHD